MDRNEIETWDLRLLIAHLGLASAAEALAIVERHVPERLLTPRTRLIVETLVEGTE